METVILDGAIQLPKGFFDAVSKALQKPEFHVRTVGFDAQRSEWVVQVRLDLPELGRRRCTFRGDLTMLKTEADYQEAAEMLAESLRWEIANPSEVESK